MLRQSIQCLAVIFALLCVTGCKSDLEQLTETCNEIETVSKMTEDCQMMAQKLAPLSESFKAQKKKLENNPPSNDLMPQYIDQTSTCMTAFLEMASGPCKNELDPALLLQDNN